MLYRLERRYGTEAYCIQVTPGVYRTDWGKHTNTVRTPIYIKRLIIFENRESTKFDFTNFAVNFKYGAEYVIGDRIVIWQSIVELDENDYFVINEKRYTVVKKVELDFESGMLLHLRETVGQERYGVFTETVSQGLTIDQEVEYEKS